MTQDPNQPGQQPPEDPGQQPPNAPAPGGQPPQGPPPEAPGAPGVNGPGPAGPPTPPPGGYQGSQPGYGGPAGTPPGQAVAGAAVEWVEVPSKGSVKLASIGQRFGARLLDIILVGVISVIIISIGFAIFAGGAATDGFDPETGLPTDGGAGTGLGLGSMVLSLLIAGIFAIAYEAIMIGLWGQTLGKMLLKIKVIRANTGAIPGIGGGIVRYIIPFFAQLIPFLGTIAYLLCYLWAAFDQRRQGWHDKVANTYVVDLKISPQV